MTALPVRVRFAPSPTGFLHLGGARTALFNWLFARHYGGVFIVRIEDTDSSRERPEFREEITRALHWLGLDADEGPETGGPYGPYTQSERRDFYAEALAQLRARGVLYPCFCGPEQAGMPCPCDALSAEERSRREARLETMPAQRMRVDQEQTHRVTDLVRGEVSFPPGEVEDFLVTKAGGAALYNFAATVDDHAMHISHVIRGEEHLANTPKQLLIANALGFDPPRFAHLPIILNAERKKLSKRDGATAVSDYERAGYLPEALCNFLALLGWSPGEDREILSREELIAAFDLDRVQRHGAVFDVVKLTWMNGEYLRRRDPATLVEPLLQLLRAREDAEHLRLDREHLIAVLHLVGERAKTLAEVAQQTYLFSREQQLAWEAKAIAQRLGDETARERLRAIASVLGELEDFDAATLESTVRSYAEAQGVKAGEYIGALRVATTGGSVSPGIFALLAVLGRDITLGRIAACLATHATESAV